MAQRYVEKTLSPGTERDTPGILFQNVLRLVKEHGHYAKVEPIIDYALADDDERKLTNYGFDFRAVISPGSSEGIYIDCYLMGKFDGSGRCSLHVGTLKTLKRDLESAKVMGELCGTLMHHAGEYVNQNLHRYTPQKELEAEYQRQLEQKNAGEASSHE